MGAYLFFLDFFLLHSAGGSGATPSSSTTLQGLPANVLLEPGMRKLGEGAPGRAHRGAHLPAPLPTFFSWREFLVLVVACCLLACLLDCCGTQL